MAQEEDKDMEGQVKDMDNILTSKMADMPIDKKENSNGKFTITDYAIAFIYGMSTGQRERFKKMLEQGYECGKSIANNYDVDYDKFIKEVRRLLNVEV